MKNLRLLSLLGLFTLFAGLNGMEQGAEEARREREVLKIAKIDKKMPNGVLLEIAKAGININIGASTKAEIFKLTDSMKRLGGRSEQTIINLVKTHALNKYKNVADPKEKSRLINEYNYGKFKNDAIENLYNKFDQKIKDKVGQKASEQEKLAAAVDLDAKIWFRCQKIAKHSDLAKANISNHGVPLEYPEARLRMAMIRLVFPGVKPALRETEREYRVFS